ncbi:hypothetical protein NF681_14030 [Comamonadaceae bacterium OTU4NAUVB1]|nr:hypothetical protein NF681_14030 [Comamonadaceae bacterium OTU4NAUVB1]
MDQSEVAMDEIVHAGRRDPQDGVPGEQSRELARLSCKTRLAVDAGGAKWLTRRLSVPEDKICAWMSHARLHGVNVLRPSRSTSSAHFKPQVLSRQDREQRPNCQITAIDDIRIPSQVVA